MSDTATIEAPPSVDRPISDLMRAAAATPGVPVPPEIVARIDAEKRTQHESANPKPADKPQPAADTKQPEAKEAPKPEKKKVELPPADKTKNPWDALPNIEDKKPEPKKEEPAAAEDEVLPKGLDEKGGVRWKELKLAAKERDQLKARIAEMEQKSQANDSGKSEMTLKELESLRKEKAEIEQLVAERRLETSEDFKKSVLEPIESANQQIAKLVAMGKLDKNAMQEAVGIIDPIDRAAAIAKVITQANKAIAAKIEDGDADAGEPLSATLQAQLDKAVDKLHGAWNKEDELRAQAREIQTAADARDTTEKTRAEKAKMEEWQTATDTIFEALGEKFPFLKDEDTARQVRERVTLDNDPMEQAMRAYAVPLLTIVTQERNSLAARVAELEGVVQDYNGGRPSTNSAADRVEAKNEMLLISPSEAARKAGYV